MREKYLLIDNFETPINLGAFIILIVLRGILYLYVEYMLSGRRCKGMNYNDEVLEDIFNRYKINGTNFNKNIEIFKAVYNDINKKYMEKLLIMHAEETNEKKQLKMDLEYIKLEKYRLENNKLGIESNVNPILVSLFVLIVTIGVTGLPNLFSELGKYVNLIINISVILAFTILSYSLTQKISKSGLKVSIYDVAIKVLNDLENEKRIRLEAM